MGSRIRCRAAIEQVLDRDSGIEVHYGITFVFHDNAGGSKTGPGAAYPASLEGLRFSNA